MRLVSRAIAPSLLLCALLPTACATSSPVAIKRLPDATLLLPLDNDIAVERIRVAQAYANCRERHAALAGWVRGQ